MTVSRPPNWRYMFARDLDLGSGGPMVFSFGARTLLATAAKESVVYLLDADSLGGLDHQTPLYMSPRLGNDIQDFQAQGVWGGMATYQNDKRRALSLHSRMGSAPQGRAGISPSLWRRAQRQHHGL